MLEGKKLSTCRFKEGGRKNRVAVEELKIETDVKAVIFFVL